MQSGIDELAAKVAVQRTLVDELAAKLSDSDLKQRLQLATNYLDDVENVFLRPARQERPTPDALAQWLSNAEAAFNLAVQKRAEVQAIVDRLGPNAQLI